MYTVYFIQEYEGVYVYGASQLEVKSERNQLLLSSNGATGSVVLAYGAPLKFQVQLEAIDIPIKRRRYSLQISFPDYLQPCLEAELLAMRRAFVVFRPPTSSSVCPGFTIPGSYPGILFERKN